MEDYERIELRSEKIRHIIGAMPSWILRYGIAIVCTVVAILVGTTAFIPYPETIGAEVIIGNTQGNKRIATAFVNYNEISKVSTGMEIFLYPEGYTSDPQYTLTGKISAIDRHVIDNAGMRTFACHIILCNNEILQEGMHAQATIMTSDKSLLEHILSGIINTKQKSILKTTTQEGNIE